MSEDIGCHAGAGSWCYQQVEARNAANILNILQCTEQPPQQTIIWPKMLIMLRMKNPAINSSNFEVTVQGPYPLFLINIINLLQLIPFGG